MPDNIALQRILNMVTPNTFDTTENILSFYKLVIELERSKEPDSLLSSFVCYGIQERKR